MSAAPPVFDDRSKTVLKLLIQLHITTGEPVGSETVSRAMDRALSSATIRNILGELERLGYLDHPHTSAGRLPTDEGYRVYVDNLMGPVRLPPGEAAAIASQLRPREGSPEQVMENASHLLSRLTRSVGFVLAPDLGQTAMRHVDLVRLPYPRVLVVMVAHTGIVTSKVVEVEEQLTQDELTACANYLSTRFAGLTLPAIRAALLDMMREEKALYDSLLKGVIAVGEKAFAGEEQPSVYLDGASNILEREGSVARLRALFKTFEEKSRLVRILNACLSSDGVRIIIGHENPDPDLHDVALVTATYPVDGSRGWGLGVLGSTRMEYDRVSALVDHVARSVAAAFAELRP